MGCLKFESDGKVVTAHATDLDQRVTYALNNAVCDTAGVFTVGFQALKDITKGADSDQIEFTTVGKDKVSVTNPIAGQLVRLELPSLDPAEWPGNNHEVKTQPADDFLTVFQTLAPFAGTDSTRHVINSCFLDIADGKPGSSCMVATDGRRLTIRNTMTLPLKESCIVPTSKFLNWLEGSSRIGIVKQGEAKWFAVESGPWTYQAKAIDGMYPNYRQVIPKEPGSNRITFADDISPLRQILKALPDEDKKGAITLRCGQNGTLAVGSRDVCIDVQGGTFTGKCKQIGVSRDYLMDALDAGFRTFTFTDEESPLVSDDGNGGKHVLMPMRIAERQSLSKCMQEANAEPTSQETTDKAPETPERKGNRKMSKTDTAIVRLQDSFEAARDKLKEANASLADLASLIKEAVKEDKQRRNEIEDVRKTVAKIQSIKV